MIALYIWQLIHVVHIPIVLLVIIGHRLLFNHITLLHNDDHVPALVEIKATDTENTSELAGETSYKERVMIGVK